ncbi:MBL fold metallo-hydrolase [Devosia sp. ZB163]|uniref:MBL fold metallo-hydrolase n=1 Tax=Devosia sp. ZB163 TaxID=3025938 RepID=UPI0023607B79|nr:MBL fold metallo-hydrolase [Devosia sp. ZB163]MDC9824174.1 MBL fold metallo-hydrolase [Devosia sp. ZB163]
MRIHHLNCGTHCPIGGAFFDGTSKGVLGNLCTHCMLLEGDDGLVLIDTGYGLQDVLHSPPRRLAYTWPLVLNTRLREADTALRQIEALGFPASDVRHIVLTHLDFDHAGGLEDFPQARIHVMETERDAAEHKRRSFVARQRYRPLMWDDVRDWRTYAAGGEAWFGFEAVRALDGLPPEILMIPLPGHTLGHAGVAIKTSDGWLLNAGDAYLNAGELAPKPHMPLGLRIYERIMATDAPAGRANLDRLRELKRNHGSAVDIFCSHDNADLERLREVVTRTDNPVGLR